LLPEVGGIVLVMVTEAVALAIKPLPAFAVAVFVETELVGVSDTWSVPFLEGELWIRGIVTLPNPFVPKAALLTIMEYPSTKFQPGNPAGGEFVVYP
jgi:hypothetical protein